MTDKPGKPPLSGIHFLEEFADKPCPICGSAKWRRAGALGNLLAAIVPVVTEDGEFVSGAGENVVFFTLPLSCAVCGFMRFHSLESLADRAREEADDAGDQ
jgi:hypothetical protein